MRREANLTTNPEAIPLFQRVELIRARRPGGRSNALIAISPPGAIPTPASTSPVMPQQGSTCQLTPPSSGDNHVSRLGGGVSCFRDISFICMLSMQGSHASVRIRSLTATMSCECETKVRVIPYSSFMLKTRIALILSSALLVVTALSACDEAEKVETGTVPYVKFHECARASTKLQEAGFTKVTFAAEGNENVPIELGKFKRCEVKQQEPEDGLEAPLSQEIKLIVAQEKVLRMAVSSCKPHPGARLVDNEKTLVLNGVGSQDPAGMGPEYLGCFLSAVRAPERVLTAMEATRALDGRQHAEWDDISAEWSYHPDQGLDVVLYMKD